MMSLIKINLEKKLNKASLIFIIISLLFVLFLAIYNANFNKSVVAIKLNRLTYTTNYIVETEEIVVAFSMLFVILLSLLELYNNTNHFDAYFVANCGRYRVIVAKVISYLIIIVLYTVSTYIILAIIYFFRFKNSYFNLLFVKLFLYTLLYLIYLFVISLALVRLTENFFSISFVLITYFLNKFDFDKKVKPVISYISPSFKYDIINNNVSFDITTYYTLSLIVVGIILLVTIYLFKDIKC